MAALSTKLQTSVSLMKNVRSLMVRLNKIGRNIDPCGIPLRISRYQLKVDLINANAVLPKPWEASFEMRRSWGRQLYALLRFINLIWVVGGVILPPSWFSLDSLKTVTAVTLAFCSIQ